MISIVSILLDMYWFWKRDIKFEETHVFLAKYVLKKNLVLAIDIVVLLYVYTFLFKKISEFYFSTVFHDINIFL